MTYTAKTKRDEVQREIKFREKVYRRLVNNGGMTQEAMDRRIGIMVEIAEDYRQVEEAERLL